MVKMFFQKKCGLALCLGEDGCNRWDGDAKASLLSRRDFSRFRTKAPALASEFLGINFNHKSLSSACFIQLSINKAKHREQHGFDWYLYEFHSHRAFTLFQKAATPLINVFCAQLFIFKLKVSSQVYPRKQLRLIKVISVSVTLLMSF